MTGPDEETYTQREFEKLSADIMPKKADIVTGDCNFGIVSYDGSGRIYASGINSRAAPIFAPPGTGARGQAFRYQQRHDPEPRQDRLSEDL